jgi:hypothetical protein
MPARGSDNDRAKLTAEQVIDIHLLARSKQYWQREIAEEFGVTQSHVSLIEHRRRWRWLFYNSEGNPMNEDELRAELDALKKRQSELEAKLAEADKPPEPFKREPYQPIDYTRGASMDRETKRDLATAIPDSLARDLRADLARGNPISQSQAMLTPDRGGRGVEIRGTGYRDAIPLAAPPGVALADRLMDMQDKIDKADLQRRLARSGRKE